MSILFELKLCFNKVGKITFFKGFEISVGKEYKTVNLAANAHNKPNTDKHQNIDFDNFDFDIKITPS